MPIRTPLAAALALCLALPASAADLLVQAGRLLDAPGQAPRAASTLHVRDGRVVEVREGHLDAAAFGLASARCSTCARTSCCPG